MGVRVRVAPTPPGWWGAYDHERRLITLRPSMAFAQQHCTLAHELGHAYYGHTGVGPKQELLANRWAANRLIRYEDVRALAGSGLTLPEVAMQLGVLPEVVRVFLTTLTFAEREGLKRPAYS